MHMSVRAHVYLFVTWCRYAVHICLSHVCMCVTYLYVCYIFICVLHIYMFVTYLYECHICIWMSHIDMNVTYLYDCHIFIWMSHIYMNVTYLYECHIFIRRSHTWVTYLYVYHILHVRCCAGYIQSLCTFTCIIYANKFSGRRVFVRYMLQVCGSYICYIYT